MRTWAVLLGGLIVWTIHFFALYGVASVFPGSDTARWLTAAVTLPALGADGLLLKRALIHAGDPFDRWVTRLAAAGAVLSAIAVLWQALPAILV